MKSLTPKQLPHPWTPSNPEGSSWYVPAWNPGYYLHRDGVVRQHIFHNGERLGYFASEAEALEAIAKFEAKQQPKPVSELLTAFRFDFPTSKVATDHATQHFLRDDN